MDLTPSPEAYAILDQVRQLFEQDILPQNREMIRSTKQDGELAGRGTIALSNRS